MSGRCIVVIWILKEKSKKKESEIIFSLQLYNPDMEFPFYCPQERKGYDKLLEHSIREPEVPFTIFPTYESVHYKGDFDFVVMAQSPNYTPASADFIMDVVRDYIIEI